MSSNLIHRFFFPAFNKRYFFRLFLIALFCSLIFGHLLIPLRIEGTSMEPTYKDNSFTFCWRLQYLFTPPERFDVVAVRFAGKRVMLLKRIVALPGEDVEFRKGVLFIDGIPIEEPYVHHRSAWQLAKRTVSPGHVYVVGDNRGTSMASHQFGEVTVNRIMGGVLP